MQFILNLYLISMAISLIGLHYNPSTQCLHICAPDQFPPANFTLFPFASTILMSFVESGKDMSSILKRGTSLAKSELNSL